MSGGRRPMTARLLWQTWRESWKRLPMPIVVDAALLLTTVVGFFSNWVHGIGPASRRRCFSLPALYGALAFSADQRRHSFAFWPSMRPGHATSGWRACRVAERGRRPVHRRDRIRLAVRRGDACSSARLLDEDLEWGAGWHHVQDITYESRGHY